MRSIAVFSTVFYCMATAVASQPDKVELYGVPRNGAPAFPAVQKGQEDGPTPKSLITLVQPSDEQDFHIGTGTPQGSASRLLFNEGHHRNLPTSLKIPSTEVNKDSDDSDRRLMQEGSIRGGKTKESIQRKRSLTVDERTTYILLRGLGFGAVMLVVLCIAGSCRS